MHSSPALMSLPGCQDGLGAKFEPKRMLFAWRSTTIRGYNAALSMQRNAKWLFQVCVTSLCVWARNHATKEKAVSCTKTSAEYHDEQHTQPYTRLCDREDLDRASGKEWAINSPYLFLLAPLPHRGRARPIRGWAWATSLNLSEWYPPWAAAAPRGAPSSSSFAGHPCDLNWDERVLGLGWKVANWRVVLGKRHFPYMMHICLGCLFCGHLAWWNLNWKCSPIAACHVSLQAWFCG